MKMRLFQLTTLLSLTIPHILPTATYWDPAPWPNFTTDKGVQYEVTINGYPLKRPPSHFPYTEINMFETFSMVGGINTEGNVMDALEQLRDRRDAAKPGTPWSFYCPSIEYGPRTSCCKLGPFFNKRKLSEHLAEWHPNDAYVLR